MIAFWAGLITLSAVPSHGATPPGAFVLNSGQVRYQVASWGPDCGPKPVTERSRKGAKYTFSATGLLSGRARPLFNSGICSAATGLPSLTERKLAGRFECASKSGSNKRVTGRIVLRSPDVNSLKISSSFSYAWSLKGSDCRLKSSGSFSLSRVEPIQAAPPPERCATPGPLAKLTAKRARRRISVGGKTNLKMAGKDADGCVVPVAAVTWKAAAGTMRGATWLATNVTVGQRVRIVATSGGQSATFSIRVIKLPVNGVPLDLAAADPTESTPDAGLNLAPQTTSAVSAHTTEPVEAKAGDSNGMLIVLFAGFCLLAVGLVGVILARTRKERSAIQAASTARSNLRDLALHKATPAPIKQAKKGTLSCEICHREFEEDTAFCPFDGSPLQTPQPTSERICSVCGAQYAGDTEFCGVDGSPLGGSNKKT